MVLQGSSQSRLEQHRITQAGTASMQDDQLLM